MNPLNPLFAITIYCIAFITAYLLNLKYKISFNNKRYESIDGLRGFLALGVFIHHSAIWHQYLHTKSWVGLDSNLYSQLGQTSVSFFFMITSFLFITKLVENKDQLMNWKSFSISRFFRLTPMYFVSISVLVLIVLKINNWELKVGVGSFLKEVFQWSTFTITGNPDINENIYTNIINAGVVWSLPYEWLFYFSLPIIAFFILKNKTSKKYILISLLFVLAFSLLKTVSVHHILSFVGGGIAPFLNKYKEKKNYNSLLISTLTIICLTSVLFFNSSDSIVCKILLIIAFNLIVLGNNLFGILQSSVLKFLGEISYSTYLIHGILIFIVMYFYYGLEKASTLSPLDYCLTLFILTPFVVIISFISFRLIEKPCIDYSKRIR